MIGSKTQARPYANALFELAVEENTCQSWHDVLALLNTVLQNADVRDMLKVRSIEAKEWVTWIQSIKPEVLDNKEVGNLLRLLAEKRRLWLLPDIFNFFKSQWRQLKNEQRFTVLAPAKLNKAQSQKFRDFLNKRFACEADITFELHPDMIGGVEVVGEGWRLDYSVHGWLKQLRDAL